MCPNTLYLSVFSPNVGKYWPEKTPYLKSTENLASENCATTTTDDFIITELELYWVARSLASRIK